MGKRLELVSGPAAEPVTLDEAKAHLRVQVADDDALITGLIIAARRLVEARLNRSLISTTWDYFLDAFPWGGGYFNRAIRANGPDPGNPNWLPGFVQPVVLPRPPLLSIVSVLYVDMAGVSQSLDFSGFVVSLGSPGGIAPAFTTQWPQVQPRPDAIAIRFTAGYGATAASVPETIKLAMKMLIGAWYENREAAQPGALAAVPFAVDALLASEEYGAY